MARGFRFPLTVAIWAILVGAGALLAIFYLVFSESRRQEQAAHRQLAAEDSLLQRSYRSVWDAHALAYEVSGQRGAGLATAHARLDSIFRSIDSSAVTFERGLTPHAKLTELWNIYRVSLDSLRGDIVAIAADRSTINGRAHSFKDIDDDPRSGALLRFWNLKDDLHDRLISERVETIAQIDDDLSRAYAGWAIGAFAFVVAGIGLGLLARRLEREQLIASLQMAAGEEQFRALVEQTQDAILIVQDGTVAFANAAALRLFEFTSLDEMKRNDVFSLAGPAVRAALLERSAGRAIGDDLARGEEVRSMTHEGRLVDLEVSASMIAWNHRSAVQATFRDITGRKMQEREQALLMWEQEALSQIDRRLIGVVDLGKILDAILGHLVNLTKAQWAGVLLREGASQRFRWRSVVGATSPVAAEAFQLAPPLRAILGGAEPFVMQEITTPPEDRLTHLAGVADERLLSSVWIPLKGDPEVRGVLAVGYRQAHEFAGRELRLLVSLAEKMSIAAENASLYEDLLSRERDLEMLSGLRVNAQEEERRRIAREIHDGLGQILTAVKFNVEILEDSSSLSADDHRRIADVKTLLDNVMKEAREISYNLMPSVLDDFGLAPALQLLAERFGAQTGVRVTFVAQGMTERLPATAEIALYRIVQEALTNAIRHGEATLVAIQAFRTPEGVRLTVEDNGRGMDPDQAMARRLIGSGIGLASMRERVNSFRGEFEIESSPGNGSLIMVHIPVAAFTNTP